MELSRIILFYLYLNQNPTPTLSLCLSDGEGVGRRPSDLVRAPGQVGKERGGLPNEDESDESGRNNDGKIDVTFRGIV